MIAIWNRKEIYNGMSLDRVSTIKYMLSSKGINYHIRVVNRTTSAGFDVTRSRVGSMGNKSNLSYEYYIYVNKKDYDEAIYILNKK